MSSRGGSWAGNRVSGKDLPFNSVTTSLLPVEVKRRLSKNNSTHSLSKYDHGWLDPKFLLVALGGIW